jgi:EAL and modified HD-GYP domain-containing signal transduction protein
VASIRHALTLLGEQNLRKWTSVVALVDLAQEKPAELIVTSLVRARFCELLASRVGLANQQTDLFLLGLLSVMDAVLDRELGDVLSDMPLSEQVKAALLGEENSLRHALDSVVAHERADWNQLRNSFDRLALREGQFPELYPEAVQWATRIFRF